MKSSGLGIARIFQLVRSCASSSRIKLSDFDKIKFHTLKNVQGTEVKITNYGATVISIIVADRHGEYSDIALGHNRVEDYMNIADKPYFGAIIGRYANRIAGGKFTLDGQAFFLSKNDGDNHLHGGVTGFDRAVWDAKPVKGDGFTGLELTCLSLDGAGGYPGNLECTVIYKLTDANELSIEYRAITDKATPVNLTNHTYFNLAGEGNGTILDHKLYINADNYTPVNGTSIPTGVIAQVVGTPFDFTSGKRIGRDIGQPDQQLQFGNGYDHNFVLNKDNGPWELSCAATVYEPQSGRFMEVLTTEPGVQFYTGNFLEGRLMGKAGKRYIRRGGFCLETQHYPDSPNHPDFPGTILRPGKIYNTQTIYRFSVKKLS